MEDWGEIALNQIESEDFWCLLDEICEENSHFLNKHNRITILDAYKTGNLYGLNVFETRKMYDRNARMDPIFCKNSWYLLPCFCVIQNKKEVLIWTHARARHMGFTEKLRELLL
jgi:hypothetical protein